MRDINVIKIKWSVPMALFIAEKLLTSISICS